MNLVTIVIVLVVVGFVLWIINTVIPMAKPIKIILNAVVTLAVLIWVLSAFGINIPGIQLK